MVVIGYPSVSEDSDTESTHPYMVRSEPLFMSTVISRYEMFMREVYGALSFIRENMSCTDMFRSDTV